MNYAKLIIGMAKSFSHPTAPPIRQLKAVVDLIETPALARVYAHILQSGPVTVAAIVDDLAVPQGSAYEYVDRLESAGLIANVRNQRPAAYDGDPLSLTLSTDGETRTITPVLIAAVARRAEDQDIDVFIERHGIDGLAVALEYAYQYVEGTVNHRIAARELDISPLEAEIILQALEPVVSTYGDGPG